MIEPDRVLAGLPVGLLSPSHASEPPKTLRSRLTLRGALYFPGLLPSRLVRESRLAALELCRAAGWMDPAGDEAEVRPAALPLRWNPDIERVARKWVSSEAYAAVYRSARLQKLLRVLLDGAVSPHPSAPRGRIAMPTPNLSPGTPPHQDLPYMGAPNETFTVWVPAGDCSRTLGGLAVLPRSHHFGPLPHRLEQALCEIPLRPRQRWETADYRIGDVLIFHSCTIHASLPNQSGRLARFSMDARFCRRQLLQDKYFMAVIALLEDQSHRDRSRIGGSDSSAAPRVRTRRRT